MSTKLLLPRDLNRTDSWSLNCTTTTRTWRRHQLQSVSMRLLWIERSRKWSSLTNTNSRLSRLHSRKSSGRLRSNWETQLAKTKSLLGHSSLSHLHYLRVPREKTRRMRISLMLRYQSLKRSSDDWNKKIMIQGLRMLQLLMNMRLTRQMSTNNRSEMNF